MEASSFLLYGANGYSGNLIARFAHEYNLKPVLAGRTEASIKPLAQQLQLPYRIIDLNDRMALEAALKEVKLVLHAAGPFQFTAKQMIEACLNSGTHYIDINGDISIFEMIKKYDAAAKEKGIMLLPGAGFDVVPTDCLALYLKNKMQAAVDLKIAFATLGGAVSHGTASSMIHKLGTGSALRRNGSIQMDALGKNGMEIKVAGKDFFVMSIPWGDVSTAYFSTGIPNIETFTGMSKKVYYLLKFQFLFNWLLRTGFMKRILLNRIAKKPAGPTDEERRRAKGYVWAQVTDAAGNKQTATLTCPEGYTITLHASLLIAQKILRGNFKAGYQTPASAYGEDLVLELPGLERQG
ncbi:MAG: saccharopine dehydrogenase NADP-binding domain-containing protein [Ferruginibacter sp.]